MSKSHDRAEGTERASMDKIDDIIKKELRNLFMKKGINDHIVISTLKAKYEEANIVHAVFDTYKERKKYIEKKAGKFKDLISNYYAERSLTQTELIKKAKKYQVKLGLSDDEFAVFINLLLSDQTPEEKIYDLPATKMAKTLGFSQAMLHTGDGLRVSINDMGIVQDILKMYGETKGLHSQIIIQSLGYADMDTSALGGELCKAKHNYFSFVHPVVAALFLPRIKLFDEQMLIANLGYIISCKKNNHPILTQPDVELYHNLIRDPNEHVCDSESAIKDIRNRYFLQTKLWDSVFNLRLGKYYSDNLTDFLVAIEQCKSSIYDAPDLTYVKDEGAILRRLLATFSIRPTLVAATRLWGMGSVAPVSGSVLQMRHTSSDITRLTTVPMATLRLPMNYSTDVLDEPTTISEALSQPQWFIENNMIIPKKQEIIHSRDVLIFYIGRRFKSIQISKLNSPYNFGSLPMTVAGWEKSNDHHVEFKETMEINKEFYLLRSIVALDILDPAKNTNHGTKQKYIGGCVAYMKKIMNFNKENKYDEYSDVKALSAQGKWFKYDPLNAGRKVSRVEIEGEEDEDENEPDEPISELPGYEKEHEYEGDDGKSLQMTEEVYNSLKENGTIFIYQKINNFSNIENPQFN